jgi:hypothetical protein
MKKNSLITSIVELNESLLCAISLVKQTSKNQIGPARPGLDHVTGHMIVIGGGQGLAY